MRRCHSERGGQPGPSQGPGPEAGGFVSQDRVTCLAHCPGLLVSLGEGSWDLQAWEFGCCHVRALQSHSEAWSHTPAAHKLWCQGVLRAWGSGEAQGCMMVGVSESSSVLVRCPVCKSSWKSRCGKGDSSHARFRVPGGSCCWGNHEYGVGSLKKGLSVHPEVASWAESRGSHHHRQFHPHDNLQCGSCYHPTLQMRRLRRRQIK